METIETIFENYKAAYSEETPRAEEQKATFSAFNSVLEETLSDESGKDYRRQRELFDSVVSYARASEKAGFVAGFKMAVNLMRECAL